MLLYTPVPFHKFEKKADKIGDDSFLGKHLIENLMTRLKTDKTPINITSKSSD